MPTDSKLMNSFQMNIINQVLFHFLEDCSDVTSVIQVEGGFSAARVFKVNYREHEFALRCWPLNSEQMFPVDRITELHRFLNHLSTFEIPVAVPLLVRDTLTSVFNHRNMFWQCEPWLSGTPVAGETLQPAQLKSAMQLLARMHLAASRYDSTVAGQAWFTCKTGPCPSIVERRNIIASYNPQKLLKLTEALQTSPTEFREPAQKALILYHTHALAIDDQLKQLEHVAVPLHPCWRDLWHDHILFENETITGLIDPTATRTDHIATDLTRLLGSWFSDDQHQWQTALTFYETIRPLSTAEPRLVKALNESAILLTPMTWIDRWWQRVISLEQLQQVIPRVQANLARLCKL